MKRTIAEQLGAFVTQVTYDELPPEVVEKAKRHILDTFGAALAGATPEEAARVKAALLAVEPGGSAPVWGTDHLATPRNAALLNGIAAHASSSTTPAVAIIPARSCYRPPLQRYRCWTSPSPAGPS